MFTSKFISHNEEETALFAADLAKKLPPGTVIALHGDLGAGKTVFARSFARALGITESVSSPTYTIVQEYPLGQERDGWLFHLDLYRIDNEISALGFGVNEFLEMDNSYSLIEWPERISGILPEKTIHINIRHINDSEREITIEPEK